MGWANSGRVGAGAIEHRDNVRDISGAWSTRVTMNGSGDSLDMLLNTRHQNDLWGSAGRRVRTAMMFVAVLAWSAGDVRAQAATGMLVTRAELTAIATRADSVARTASGGERTRSAMLAASIRQRLRDGDFQVGDRVVVTIVSDAQRKDTVVVRSGGFLELPDRIVVPVTGVLRSELLDRVTTEVLKYIKARQIEVMPLMRVGVLGEVARPGYFAFASDLPLTEAIMGAGGPTTTADLERSIVRRGNQPFRSTEETRRAIAGGLTLDQFGLNAGDEIIIGRRSNVNPGSIIGMVSALGGVVAVFVAMQHR